MWDLLLHIFLVIFFLVNTQFPIIQYTDLRQTMESLSMYISHNAVNQFQQQIPTDDIKHQQEKPTDHIENPEQMSVCDLDYQQQSITRRNDRIDEEKPYDPKEVFLLGKKEPIEDEHNQKEYEKASYKEQIKWTNDHMHHIHGFDYGRRPMILPGMLINTQKKYGIQNLGLAQPGCHFCSKPFRSLHTKYTKNSDSGVEKVRKIFELMVKNKNLNDIIKDYMSIGITKWSKEMNQKLRNSATEEWQKLQFFYFEEYRHNLKNHTFGIFCNEKADDTHAWIAKQYKVNKKTDDPSTTEKFLAMYRSKYDWGTFTRPANSGINYKNQKKVPNWQRPVSIFFFFLSIFNIKFAPTFVLQIYSLQYQE